MNIISKILLEQNKEDINPEEETNDIETLNDEQQNADSNQNQNMEDAQYSDEYPPEEEPEIVVELGKVYELKGIFQRLDSIDRILKNLSDNNLDDIKLKVQEAISIFQAFCSNLGKYGDQTDLVIKRYRRFLTSISIELDKRISLKKGD